MFELTIHRTPLRSGPSLLSSVPLYPGYGTHFVYMFIGRPLQRQSLILDTGSHYIAMPCEPCPNCGAHPDPYFDITASTTAQENKCGHSRCNIHQFYAEGSSWSGYSISDLLFASDRDDMYMDQNGLLQSRMTFACISTETGKNQSYYCFII